MLQPRLRCFLCNQPLTSSRVKRPPIHVGDPLELLQQKLPPPFLAVIPYLDLVITKNCQTQNHSLSTSFRLNSPHSLTLILLELQTRAQQITAMWVKSDLPHSLIYILWLLSCYDRELSSCNSKHTGYKAQILLHGLRKKCAGLFQIISYPLILSHLGSFYLHFLPSGVLVQSITSTTLLPMYSIFLSPCLSMKSTINYFQSI